MPDFAATEHDISANVVSAGREPTGARNNFRSSDTAANVPAHGDGRRCWWCNQVGHTKRECKKYASRNQTSFALCRSKRSNQTWILDSGASRRLVMDETILFNAVDCFDE